MARIPESAVTVRQGGGSIQPIREVVEIGRAITDTIGAAVDLTDRLALADRKVELSRMSASMEASLADLQLEISQNPDLDTVEAAEQAFDGGAEQIFSALGQSSSQAVNEALEAQFLRSSLQGRVFVKRAGYQRQADAAIAGLEADSDGLERAYASAQDDEKRGQIRALHARNINLSDYLTEQQKGDRIRRFETATDTGHVLGLIGAGAFDLAEDMLLDPSALTGMDELQRQAMIRTLNTARDKGDASAKLVRKALEDDTAKAALLTMATHEEEGGPEYTFADFQRDLPDLSVQHARTVRASMEKQGIPTVDDIPTVDVLNSEVESGNADVVDHIHSSLRAGLITRPTFDGLLNRDKDYNEDPIRHSPYKQSAKDIREALGPSEIETDLKLKGAAVERRNNAIDELDHFRQTHPQATPSQIFGERDRILAAYRQFSLNDTSTLPIPYSLGDRLGITLEQLDQAEAKLGRDYTAGIVDDWKLTRESENIRIFRGDLERRATRDTSR